MYISSSAPRNMPSNVTDLKPFQQKVLLIFIERKSMFCALLTSSHKFLIFQIVAVGQLQFTQEEVWLPPEAMDV